MTIQKFWRPLSGVIGKRFVVGVQVTKSRYFAKDASAPQFAPTSGTSGDFDDFLNKHEIKITGKNTKILKPIFSFNEAKFPDTIIGALKRKYETPSVIQSVSWPTILSGRDLVGIARTGSGKTLAFLLPALVHISKQERTKRYDGPVVLVLCPTRELAQQVEAVANEWSGILTRVRTTCIFGGANRVPQERALTSGVEIVVATPGRLNDFLSSRSTNLDRCSYLVLDEADRMLDMGFEPQISEIIERITGDRQTLMYSATWPKEVKELAGNYMKDYVHVKIGSADLSANKNITQNVHVTTVTKRDNEFWQLLDTLRQRDPNGKILVFSLQKLVADRLAYRGAEKGFAASAIHGDKSQAMRDSVLNKFRRGNIKVLFATDVAARGLDVDDISCVVNYDHPMCAEDYVHRIGRTARRDLKGESHTFLTENDAGEHASELIKILEASNQPIPQELKVLADKLTTSSKNLRRRWGSSGGFSRSSFRPSQRDSYFNFDRRPKSRYDRYDDGHDNTVERYDFRRNSNRYSNFDDQRRQSNRRDRDFDDYEKDEFDFDRGGGRKF